MARSSKAEVTETVKETKKEYEVVARFFNKENNNLAEEVGNKITASAEYIKELLTLGLVK